MRKVLLSFAAMLLAVVSAAAQQKRVEFRNGDAFRGPVKSVRMERAEFVMRDGEPVEGERRLIKTAEYTPDGKRSESVSYHPDGAQRSRSVQVYDDGGRLIDEAHYDEENTQCSRKSYVRRGDEVLTFDGQGKLLQRVITTWNEKRDKMVEVRTFDAAGVLTRRLVNTYDEVNKKSTWTTYGPDGNPIERSVHDINYGGPHRTEQTKFKADGSIAGTRVSTSDAATSKLGAVEAGPDGTPKRKMSETREYDSHRNLSKLTNFRWDEAAGKFVPSAVTYYYITYY